MPSPQATTMPPSVWSSYSAQLKTLTKPGNNTVMDPPIFSLITHLNRLSPLSARTATNITDIGSGNGSVFTRMLDPTFANLHVNPAAKLVATDYAEGMIAQLRETQAAAVEADPASAWARVESAVLDAQDLSTIEAGSVSHVVSSFALFMVPQYERALAEIHRVLAPGGVLALSSHKGNEWMECVRGFGQDENKVLPTVWTSVEGVETLLRRAGFGDVESEEVALKMSVEQSEQGLTLPLGS